MVRGRDPAVIRISTSVDSPGWICSPFGQLVVVQPQLVLHCVMVMGSAPELLSVTLPVAYLLVDTVPS